MLPSYMRVLHFEIHPHCRFQYEAGCFCPEHVENDLTFQNQESGLFA